MRVPCCNPACVRTMSNHMIERFYDMLVCGVGNADGPWHLCHPGPFQNEGLKEDKKQNASTDSKQKDTDQLRSWRLDNMDRLGRPEPDS